MFGVYIQPKFVKPSPDHALPHLTAYRDVPQPPCYDSYAQHAAPQHACMLHICIHTSRLPPSHETHGLLGADVGRFQIVQRERGQTRLRLGRPFAEFGGHLSQQVDIQQRSSTMPVGPGRLALASLPYLKYPHVLTMRYGVVALDEHELAETWPDGAAQALRSPTGISACQSDK